MWLPTFTHLSTNMKRVVSLLFSVLVASLLVECSAVQLGGEDPPAPQPSKLFYDELSAAVELQDVEASATATECEAPAFEMGPICNSTVFMMGDSVHNRIDYKICTKDKKATMVFCYGLGLGYCHAPFACKWGYHFLGLTSIGTASLLWGKQTGHPSIKCTGKYTPL